MLYPLSIIYYIFPFDRAFNLFLVFHVFLGGVFAYLLAKEWGLRSTSALVSAITFMFSGFTISTINLATTLSSMIWLPMVLLFYTKALKDNTKYILLSGVALCLMFLGGEPSILYFTCWALFFYTIWSIFDNAADAPVVSLARGVKIFSLAVVISLALASFQLLPFVELIFRSDRTAIAPEQLTIWSMHIKDLVNFIIPYFFGADIAREAVIREQVWAPNIYAGAFTPLLIVLAFLSGRDRKRNFLFFLALLFLLLALGKNTPLYLFASKMIPGMGMVRYPVRCLFMVDFCFAMLSGLGYDAYLKDVEERRKKTMDFFNLLLPLLLALGILFLCLHLFRGDILSFIQRFAGGLRAERVISCAGIDIGNVKRFLGFFLTGAMLLYLSTKMAINRKILNWSFLTLAAVEFFTATSGLQGMVSREDFHRLTPNIEFLMKDESIFRAYVSRRTEYENGFLNREKPYGEAVVEVQDRLCTNRLIEYGIYDAGGYESMRLMAYNKMQNLIDMTRSPSDTKLPDLLNVKYIGTLSPIDDPAYIMVNKGAAYLYENKNVLPRAFLVGEYVVIKDEKSLIEKLRSKEFDPAREVILEEEPEGYRAKSAENRRGGVEEVRIGEYTANEAVMDVVTDAPKFLVFSDQYYPGWKAYVDGKPVKVYKADFVLKAVHIKDAGPHTVKFLFDPFLFKLGCAISFMTLLYILWRVAFYRAL